MRLQRKSSRRPGTITVIVVAFLGLLLIMGLTFAFYGLREAEESRVYRDSQNGGQTGVQPNRRSSSGQDQPPEPDSIFNATMASVLYGPDDDLSGAFNGLRQHDMARGIYGRDTVADRTNPFNSTQAFNGVGRRSPSDIHGPGVPANMVNFVWLGPASGLPMLDSDNNWQRDPRTNTPGPNPLTYRYYARNANYTYQDENNLFLAAVDPTSGRVLVPSYHRHWLVGVDPPPNAETGPNSVVADPNNPWLSPTGRLMMLRPRPIDHQFAANLSDWRYPTMNADGSYGDVENLPGKPGGRQLDSLWMDLDLPVAHWQGKAYKPMVAFLIVDLDGRLNLNVAGNYPSDPTAIHSSNQGVGPWEMNAEKVLSWPGPGPAPAGWNEARQLVIGEASGTLSGHHRYGENTAGTRVPRKPYTIYSSPSEQLFPNMPAPGSGAHAYSAVDFDGRLGAGKFSDYSTGHETALTWGLPYQGQPGVAGDPPRPHQNSRFKNGIFNPPFVDERTNHPSMYHPYLVRSRRAANLNYSPRDLQNRAFGIEELRYLNEKYNYGDYSQSEMARLAPATLGKGDYTTGLNRRFAVTPTSNDIDLPGATAWLASQQNLNLVGLPPAHPTTAPPAPINFNTPNPSASTPPPEDFDTASFRAKLTHTLGPVDVDRKLTDYRGDAGQPYGAANMGNAVRAKQDRQELARDIFNRLRFVTTGAPPTSNMTYGANDPNYNGLRWLAQLAVNIVDYIDNDDYMTPFNWNPGAPAAPADGSGNPVDAAKQGWVFGFERPRLVINEVYGRYENDPTDPGPMQDPPQAATRDYIAKFWVELHNPNTPANAAEIGIQSDGGAALLFNSTSNQTVYKVEIVTQQAQTQLDQLDNVLGVVTTQGQQKILASSSFTTVGPNMTHDRVAPNQLDAGGQGYTSLPQQVMGTAPAFFLLASEKNLPDDTAQADLQANRIDTSFTYPVPRFDPTQPNLAPTNELSPRVILRRLANPHLPPSQDNPYLAVDYFKMDKLMMNNALSVDTNGVVPKGKGKGKGLLGQLITWNQNRSYGRRQPFAACKFPDANPTVADISPYMQYSTNDLQGNPLGGVNGVTGEYIQHTLARHNGVGDNWAGAVTPHPTTGAPVLDQPFQPIAHLDRILLSPAELLHVAAVRPFHFSHSFSSGYDGVARKMNCVDPATGRVFYTANWLDDGVAAGGPGLYLWRALDYLRASNGYDTMGGRVPGKININTIPRTAPEIFAAAADAQGGTNRFTEAVDVARAWDTLVTSALTGRTPGAGIASTDRPLWGTASAVGQQSPSSSPTDRRRTVAAPNGLWPAAAPGNDEAFTSGAGGRAGTMQKYELMSKVFNNFTTRSNVFAVYTTIGYFEVKNAGPYNEINRPILGKELGLDEGQVLRHKFFAVIDRTNLTVELPQVAGTPVRQGPPPVYMTYQPNVPAPAPGPAPGGNNNTITPDPIYTGAPPGGMPIELRLPIIGSESLAAGQTGIIGHYDGTVWTIRPGVSWLMIDIGERQELVQVPTASGSNPFPVRVDPGTNTGIITVIVNRPHYRGCAIRLVNPDPALPGMTTIGATNYPTTMPGNPGPQPGFNYKAPRYSGVVRYVEQLK